MCMEKDLQLRYVGAQFTVLKASYGALIAVDSHGNKYVYKLYVTSQHLKFATDLLTPVIRR